MRKTIPLTLTSALVLSLAGPAAGRDFDFLGGGWGHGVGLSQYGAYGLAKKGWSPGSILRTYYRNTSIVARDAPSGGAFRVGLLQNRGTFDVKANRGSYELRLSSGAVVDTVA
ncbi:MAG TPA: hypothetical protein VEA19_03605, partial [Actinomycetota bacterium]|nr:hypothetical protein [Actinomycetota bacterium]